MTNFTQAVECCGIVKRWIADKGFGFLMPDGGGSDVWVHKSELVAVKELSVGDKVSFLKVDDGKGRGKFRALHVKVTQAGTHGSIFKDLEAAEKGTDEGSPAAGPGVAGGGLGEFLEVAGEAGDSSREAMQDFVLLSSLQCPFLVLSEGQLVGSVRAPSSEEFQRLLRLVEQFVEARRAVMLIDFEGEMPGYGGELTTAQLQLTSTVAAETLVPQALPCSQRFRAPGLFIDLRSEPCIAMVRRVLESSAITKLGWGSEGDCQSLIYQELPVPLRISPVAVIDAQLAFDANYHISMARMLEHVPQHLLTGLPGKEQIDWDAFHSQNRRALPMPLGQRSAMYAIDDMHRMEAIIGSKAPPSGSYVAARAATETFMAELCADPCCLKALEQELMWFEKKDGIRKTVKAVEVARHVHAIRARGAKLGFSAQSFVERTEAAAAAELSRAGVLVPCDLSFNSPPLEAAAEVEGKAE
eukprot:CAMPEP_0180622640 /NCGR_PEP_ID=MMETSP1037_2-20121125/35793_1 /TAXON_ID=632150 /ORGANISM="Azadinium spinosum, Strain 3D9" /LENGTH=469 /DNA_ID=CAMNT_0022642903 /DNA_START=67 /DNA_END=1473 /DNA_ORIENTATION=-